MVAAASAAARAEAQAGEAARSGEPGKRKAGEKGKARAKPQLRLASVTEQPVAARKAMGLQRSALLSSTRIQPALMISQPGDAAEAEADRVAAHVMAMPSPGARPSASGGGLQRSPLILHRAPAAPADNVADPATEAAVKKELSGGSPMSADVAGFFGRRFHADFSGVRIHTDGKAENLSTRLGARAFTYGRHVFFNAGQYNPDTEDGSKLIAHELTHTIQQQAAIQLKESEAPRVGNRTERRAQRGIVSKALNWIADKANYIPGFRLFTIVIGVNPINMSTVERSGANILRALIEFIPGGGLIVDALNNHGIFEKGGKFIEDQFRSLGMVGSAFRDALMEFIDSLGWSDIFHLGDVWDRAKRIFTAPVDKLIAFGKGLVTGIAKIVKDAILKPLGRYAASVIPKWDLLVGVFGKNPVSDEGQSPAATLIGAFMELIGQKEIWDNIQKGGAVGKAWNWFKGVLSEALGLVKSIPGRFMDTLRSLTIFDIVTIVGAWVKFAKLFGGFVADFFKWAGGKVLKLLEIILEVVAPSVIPYLKKAGAAFNTIIKAPGRFIGNLVKAGKAGFNQFKANILDHLKRGIFDWLLGSIAEANIYIPTSFDLKEILKFGLSVVGLTWVNIRAKLVAATNETVVVALETGFDLVKTLVTQGPMAAWQQLLENLSNLKQMAMDAIVDFIKNQVIQIAIEKVVSMLVPAAAFIQALLSIYRTVMFVVNEIKRIAAVVAAIIDGISAIASGVIGPAANRVENILARGLSLAISFLANFAGLGAIPKKVIEIVKKIRDPVDKAVDKVVKWIVDQAKKLGKMIAKGAKSLLNWWKEKRRPKLGDGQTHTLSFEGSAKSARLMLASKKAPVEQHLADAASDTSLSGAAKGRAAKALQFYTKNIAPISGKPIPDTPPPAITALLDALPNNLNTFTDMLIAIADTGIAPPPATPAFAGPGSASIDMLSNMTSRGGEDARSGMPGGWDVIVRRGLTSRNGNWVRMHMISAGFGGKDIAGNLVPTPTAVNTGSSVRSFERAVEKVFYGDKSAKDVRSGTTPFSAVSSRKAVMWVKTTTGGFWPQSTEIDPVTTKPLYDGNSFVKSVSLSAGMYFPKDGNWVKDSTVLAQGGSPVPKPDFSGTYVPNINAIGRPLLKTLAGITEHYARDVVDRGPHTSAASFRKNMAAGRTVPLSTDVIEAINAVIKAVADKKLKWKD